MMLGNMLPSFALKRISHGSVANAIFSGESRRPCALSVTLSRLNNLFFGEFCMWMVRPACLASLCHFIVHIEYTSAQKMMSRIATGGIVAFVTDDKVVRYRAICQLVGDAVSQKRLATATNMDSPIAKFVCATLPLPTIVGAKNTHAQPEAICDGAKTRVMSVDEAKWFAFYMVAPIFISCREFGLLSASALAKAVGNIKRGIMGLHKKLTFLVSKPRAIPVAAGLLLLVRTPVIVTQVSA